MLDEGCRYWLDRPPTLSQCRACPVVSWFCGACRRLPICGIHKYPKRFPAVSRFLTRFNLARLLHQEMWFGDWRDVSMKEWTMIQLAMRTTLKMEHEQMKDAIPKGRKHG